MRRSLLAGAAALALLAAACGGGGSETNPTSAAGSSATPTATLQSIPKPTPPQPGEPIVQVNGSESSYKPTRADVEKLDTSTITVDGKKYTGVTLATLAAKVSAPDTATATVLGTQPSGARIAGARLSLQDDGAKTVFVLEPDGYLHLVSSSLDDASWLIDVTEVDFQ